MSGNNLLLLVDNRMLDTVYDFSLVEGREGAVGVIVNCSA